MLGALKTDALEESGSTSRVLIEMRPEIQTNENFADETKEDNAYPDVFADILRRTSHTFGIIFCNRWRTYKSGAMWAIVDVV